LRLLAHIFVNDAFASSHRANASIAGITKFLPSYAGLRLQKEVEELSKVINNPQRPLCVIIGGAKIETKLPLVEKMHNFADFVLVGGELSEKDSVLIRVMHEKADKVKSMLFVADLKDSKKEITDYSTENFIQVINKSRTVVWNGPLGQTEEEEYAGETRKLARAIAKSQAYSIVGGGDTVAFLQKEGLADKFSFVSTGGGAMLEFLAGEKLPGLAALTK
jgi:phosphoglycerate kinase